MKIRPLHFLTLLLAGASTVLAQSQPAGFEEPPLLSAAAILKPEFAAGPGFTVRDPVITWAGRNSYTVDSDFGISRLTAM